MSQKLDPRAGGYPGRGIVYAVLISLMLILIACTLLAVG